MGWVRWGEGVQATEPLHDSTKPLANKTGKLPIVKYTQLNVTAAAGESTLT